MSFAPGQDPKAGDAYACDALENVVVPRTADLGDGFTVRRALPSARTRMVGPFIFFDRMGPVARMAARKTLKELEDRYRDEQGGNGKGKK